MNNKFFDINSDENKTNNNNSINDLNSMYNLGNNEVNNNNNINDKTEYKSTIEYNSLLMGKTNDIRDQKPDPTEALIKDYIGPNSNKITGRIFNLSALFFNAFYLFYRKLFSYGILLSIITAVLSYYTNTYIITLIVSIACCFGFNPLYIIFVKRRVKKIQLEHPDATYEQLKFFCESEGGTSGSLVVKGIFVNILIAILTAVILITLGIGTTWKNFEGVRCLNYQKWKRFVVPLNRKYVIKRSFL